MSITNLNPKLADQLVYTAHSLVTSDRLQLTAANDTLAKVALIDKLGYMVELNRDMKIRVKFVLVDADEPSIVEAALKSEDYEAALDEVLTAAKWTIGEPQEMLGGSLSAGFGTEGVDA